MSTNSYSLTSSMWGADLPNTYDFTFDDLYFELTGESSRTAGGRVIDILGVYADLYAKVTLNYTLGFGLVAQLSLDAGSIDLDYEFDPHSKLSDALETLNRDSYVDTGDYEVTKTSIATSGMHLEDSGLSVDLVGKLETSLDFSLNAEIGVDLLLDTLSDSSSVGFSVPLVDINPSVTLAEIGFGDDPLELEEFGFAVSLQLPEGTAQSSTQSVEDVADGLADVETSHVSDPFAVASMDFVQIMAALCAIPGEIFKGTVRNESGLFYTELDYTLISEVLAENAALKQEFSFDATRVDVTMVSEFGPTYKIDGFSETVDGQLGDKLEFETPEGEGTFKVTATYQLHGTFTVKNYIEFYTSYTLTMLGGDISAGLTLLDYDIELADRAIGPLVEEEITGLPIDVLFQEWSADYDFDTTVETYTIAWEKFYTGTSGNDSFVMTMHQETVDAGAGNDSITGNALADIILGNDGNDTLVGLAADDILNGGNGGDVLDGGAGRDTASYEGASLGVYADLTKTTQNTNSSKGDTYISIENFTGSSFADVLWGDGGANVLAGGDGNDELHGRGGADTLVGGRGADKLYGEAGRDVFLYTATDQLGDSIFDFSRGDRIAFDAAAFNLTQLVRGSNFISGTRPVATNGVATLLYSTTTQDLFWDADGTGGGGAVLVAHVKGGVLSTGDITLL